jgi:hypothetical protein
MVSVWKRRIEEIMQSGRKVVAWGAGARAVSFLNALKIREEVPLVADINPKRQGKYMPGTGQRVVSPEFLVGYQPEVIIVTNPTFEVEIKLQAKDLGLSCDFLTL